MLPSYLYKTLVHRTKQDVSCSETLEVVHHDTHLLRERW